MPRAAVEGTNGGVSVLERAARVLERRQRLEHLLVVAVDADPLPDLAYLALSVDQEGGALDAHRDLAVHVLLPPGAVALGHLMASVGEEGEVEAVLVAELAMAGYVVRGDPEDHGPLGLEILAAVTEGARLLGAA